MSCEKNQTKTANAAQASGGIPGVANRFAGVVHQAEAGGPGGVEPVARPVEPTRTGLEILIKSPDQRTVELAREPGRQQAMLQLQEKYTGLQLSQTNLKRLLGPGAQYHHLVDESWLAEGPLGALLYDQTEAGQCTLHGIEPRLGQELELRDGLAFYGSQPPAPTDQKDKRVIQKLNKLGRWARAHQDELGLLVQQAFTAAFTLGSLKAGSILLNKALKQASPGEPLQKAGAIVKYVKPSRTVFSVSALSKELGYAGMLTGLVAGTYLGLKRVKRRHAALQKAVEAIKSPERKKAAILLQKNYEDLQLSEQELAGLMRATPVLLDEHTGKVSGDLGTIYYDTPERGRLLIRRILPALGQELLLQKGLDELKARAPADQWVPEANDDTFATQTGL